MQGSVNRSLIEIELSQVVPVNRVAGGELQPRREHFCVVFVSLSSFLYRVVKAVGKNENVFHLLLFEFRILHVSP